MGQAVLEHLDALDGATEDVGHGRAVALWEGQPLEVRRLHGDAQKGHDDGPHVAMGQVMEMERNESSILPKRTDLLGSTWYRCYLH